MTKKPRKEIISQYDLTPSSLDKWIKEEQSYGSQISISSLTATLPF
jgi:transposase